MTADRKDFHLAGLSCSRCEFPLIVWLAPGRVVAQTLCPTCAAELAGAARVANGAVRFYLQKAIRQVGSRTSPAPVGLVRALRAAQRAADELDAALNGGD